MRAILCRLHAWKNMNGDKLAELNGFNGLAGLGAQTHQHTVGILEILAIGTWHRWFPSVPHWSSIRSRRQKARSKRDNIIILVCTSMVECVGAWQLNGKVFTGRSVSTPRTSCYRRKQISNSSSVAYNRHFWRWPVSCNAEIRITGGRRWYTYKRYVMCSQTASADTRTSGTSRTLPHRIRLGVINVCK